MKCRNPTLIQVILDKLFSNYSDFSIQKVLSHTIQQQHCWAMKDNNFLVEQSVEWHNHTNQGAFTHGVVWHICTVKKKGYWLQETYSKDYVRPLKIMRSANFGSNSWGSLSFFLCERLETVTYFKTLKMK